MPRVWNMYEVRDHLKRRATRRRGAAWRNLLVMHCRKKLSLKFLSNRSSRQSHSLKSKIILQIPFLPNVIITILLFLVKHIHVEFEHR